MYLIGSHDLRHQVHDFLVVELQIFHSLRSTRHSYSKVRVAALKALAHRIGPLFGLVQIALQLSMCDLGLLGLLARGGQLCLVLLGRVALLAALLMPVGLDLFKMQDLLAIGAGAIFYTDAG